MRTSKMTIINMLMYVSLIVFMRRDAYVLSVAFCNGTEPSSVNVFHTTFLLATYLIISKLRRLFN